MIELLLSPFGLVVIAAAFYYSRRTGELKFTLPGHTEFANRLNQLVLENWHLTSNRGSDFNYELKHIISNHIRSYMDNHRISRTKAHDLKHTVQKYIEEHGKGHGTDIEFNVSRSSIAYGITKLFNDLIEAYDREQKNWTH